MDAGADGEVPDGGPQDAEPAGGRGDSGTTDPQPGGDASDQDGAMGAGVGAPVADMDSGAPPLPGERILSRPERLLTLKDGRVVLYSYRRGLQVLDLRDPMQPRLEAQVPLPSLQPDSAADVASLLQLDERVLVTVTRDGYDGLRDDIPVADTGGLVALVDLRQKSEPKLLATHPLGLRAGSPWLVRDGRRDLLYLFRWLPRGDEDGQVSIAGDSPTYTELVSLEVTASGFVERDVLRVDSGRLFMSAELLAIVRSTDGGRLSDPNPIELVSTADRDGELSLGGALRSHAAVFAVDFAGEQLRVVSGATDPGRTAAGIEVFAVGNPLQPDQLLSRCLFSQSGSATYLQFVGDSVVAKTLDDGDSIYVHAIDADGQCHARTEHGLSAYDQLYPPFNLGTRLFAGRNVAGDDAVWALDLLDVSTWDQPAARLAALELPGAVGEMAFLPSARAAAADGFPGVFVQALFQYPHRDLRFGTFSGDTLHPGGVVVDALNGDGALSGLKDITALGGNLVGAITDSTLIGFDLTAKEQPQAMPLVQLGTPHIKRVFGFGEHLVRVAHYPAEGRVEAEVLAPGADANGTAIVAQRTLAGGPSASPELFIAQVGDLLVTYRALQQAGPEPGAQGRSEVEVLDFSDPTQPQHRATLFAERAPLPFVGRALGPDMLVFGEVVRDDTVPVADGFAYHLNVVNLSDPGNPQWEPTLVIPGAYIEGPLWVDGRRIYLSGKDPDDPRYPDSEVRRIRVVDFNDMQNPVVQPVIASEGEVVAAGGDAVFTRVHDRVFRYALPLSAPATDVSPSAYVLPERRIHDVKLVADADQLLLIEEAAQAGTGWPPLPRAERLWQLHLLSATTMQRLGQVALDLEARLEFAADGKALVKIPGGTLLVDIEDPARPRAQGFVPEPTGRSQVALYTSQAFFELADGRVVSRDPQTQNLLQP